jgi:phage terminase small subunit
VSKLRETPKLIRTPSGYVQQSPWISIANKQLGLMGRFMAELGITPTARSRIAADLPQDANWPTEVRIVFVDPDGVERDRDGKPVSEATPGSLTLDSRL